MMDSDFAIVRENSLLRIAKAATLAPSAENLQPWHLFVDQNLITVSLDTRQALASDVHQMLALTAIGACVENAVIAASVEGYGAVVEPLENRLDVPQAEQFVPIAHIRFTLSTEVDPLAYEIAARSTDRRMTSGPRIPEAMIRELEDCHRQFSETSIHWVDNEKRREFADLVGIASRIRLEIGEFCSELLRSLRYTESSVRETRDGLDIETLQLPKGVPAVVRMLRTWPRMKRANRFGFSRAIARQTAKEVLQCSAVGFLTVPTEGDGRLFVTAGRALERVWLKATQLQLSFHPMAALPVFLAYAGVDDPRIDSRHRNQIAKVSHRYQRLFPNLSTRTMQIAFRVGYPAERRRTLRRDLKDAVTYL